MCVDFLYKFYKKYISFYEEFSQILSYLTIIRTVGAEFHSIGRTGRHDEVNTVIPRLTSDPANEFFG